MVQVGKSMLKRFCDKVVIGNLCDVQQALKMLYGKNLYICCAPENEGTGREGIVYSFNYIDNNVTMDKLLKPGRLIFATGIIGLGILCIISKDFIVGRPPAWPAGWAMNPALAYISGIALLLAAIAIIFNKKAGLAAVLIAALIFLLSVLRHLPHFMDDWGNAYKSMALTGGALIIAWSFFKEEGRLHPGSGINENWGKGFITAGSILLGAFLIACGYAHFKFPGFVRDYIPAYIPFRLFLAYFCGVCLFAGGAGVIIPATRRWAALLSGIMVMGWFLLLHIPRFIDNIHDTGDQMGLCESFAFAGIFFALAGMLSDKS